MRCRFSVHTAFHLTDQNHGHLHNFVAAAVEAFEVCGGALQHGRFAVSCKVKATPAKRSELGLEELQSQGLLVRAQDVDGVSASRCEMRQGNRPSVPGSTAPAGPSDTGIERIDPSVQLSDRLQCVVTMATPVANMPNAT